jgi:hypothetical protein
MRFHERWWTPVDPFCLTRNEQVSGSSPLVGSLDLAYLSRFLVVENYNTLRLRLEIVHASVEAAAVEARRRVRLNEGR